MLDVVSSVADLVLIFLTIVVVGKRPTAAKVTGMIILVTLVDYGLVVYLSLQANMSPIEWYQQLLTQTMEAYSSVMGMQPSGLEASVAIVAGMSPAIYVLQSSIYVFVGLCVRWIVDRIRKKSAWSPFSQVDLSIWWLMPLILGLCCYIASLFLGGDTARIVWIVSLNLFVVASIPLFVQGAAAGKGIMNRFGLGLGLQIVIGVLALLSGLAFLIVPLMGLVDFWANFRRLDRGDKPQSKELAK